MFEFIKRKVKSFWNYVSPFSSHKKKKSSHKDIFSSLKEIQENQNLIIKEHKRLVVTSSQLKELKELKELKLKRSLFEELPPIINKCRTEANNLVSNGLASGLASELTEDYDYSYCSKLEHFAKGKHYYGNHLGFLPAVIERLKKNREDILLRLELISNKGEAPSEEIIKKQRDFYSKRFSNFSHEGFGAKFDECIKSLEEIQTCIGMLEKSLEEEREICKKYGNLMCSLHVHCGYFEEKNYSNFLSCCKFYNHPDEYEALKKMIQDSSLPDDLKKIYIEGMENNILTKIVYIRQSAALLQREKAAAKAKDIALKQGNINSGGGYHV